MKDYNHTNSDFIFSLLLTSQKCGVFFMSFSYILLQNKAHCELPLAKAESLLFTIWITPLLVSCFR